MRRNADTGLRELERAWRAAPDDELARQAYTQARHRAGLHHELVDAWQEEQDAANARESETFSQTINPIWAECIAALRRAHPRIRRSRRQDLRGLEDWAIEVLGRETVNEIVTPFRERVLAAHEAAKERHDRARARLDELAQVTIPLPGPEIPWRFYTYSDSSWDKARIAAEKNARVETALARRLGVQARWAPDQDGDGDYGRRGYRTFANVSHRADLLALTARVRAFVEARDAESRSIYRDLDAGVPGAAERRDAWWAEEDTLKREGGQDGPAQFNPRRRSGKLRSYVAEPGALLHVRIVHPDDIRSAAMTAEPMIPDRPLASEDDSTPRVCLAPTLGGCLAAIEGWNHVAPLDVDYAERVVVYENAEPVEVMVPSRRLVADAPETGEVWALEPVRLRIVDVEDPAAFQRAVCDVLDSIGDLSVDADAAHGLKAATVDAMLWVEEDFLGRKH